MNIDNLSDEELWQQLGPKPKRQAGFFTAPVLPTDILRMADVVISDTGCHGIGILPVIGDVISSASQAASLTSFVRSALSSSPTGVLDISNFCVSAGSNMVGAVNLIYTASTLCGSILPKPAKTALTAVNNIANGTSPYIDLSNQIIAATQGSISVGGNGLLSAVGDALGHASTPLGHVGTALSVSAGPVGVILSLSVTTASVASTMDVYGTLWDLRQHLYPCICGQCDGRLKFIIKRYDQMNSAKAMAVSAGFMFVGLLPAIAIGIRKLRHFTQGHASQKHQMCLQMIQAARSRGLQMEGTPGAAPVNGKPCMPGYQVTTPGCPTAIATIALLMGEHGTKYGYLKTLAVMLSTDGVDTVKKKIP